MRRAAIVAGVLAAAAGGARAQSSAEEGRFFIDKADEDLDETLWQGSLTTSTFYFRESGGQSPADGNQARLDNASPYSRMWADLRAQVDARHVKGGRWDARLDTRLRYVANPFAESSIPDLPGTDQDRVQSGTFGRNELELRELYLVRGGRRSDLFLGRQVIADLGAIKIDGLRVDYAKNRRWTYLGFLGLYPARGSRSIATDYPKGLSPTVPGQSYTQTGRVMPVAAGGGGAYRTQRTYGALGAVLIVPTSRDGGVGGTGTYERPRAYVSANGYYRRSSRLDLFHYLVVDLVGSAGFALTNASAGAQWKPSPRLRAHLQVNQIDTEALNVQVRSILENDQPLDGAVINNLVVQRVSAQSARAALTGAFGKLGRFEVSAAVAGRRRPEVVLDAGNATQTLPAAQALEVMLQVVDREFYGGWRVDGMYLRSVGVGAASYARSRAQTFRLAGTREIRDGRGEVGADVQFTSTADDNAGMDLGNGVLASYGSANTSSLFASGLAYYRLRASWFANTAVGLGTQKITTTDPGTGGGVPQTSTLYGHAFLRIGYRF